MLRKVTIDIPKSTFDKMIELRNNNPKTYFYLLNAVNSYLDKNMNCENFPKTTKQIRFTISKKKDIISFLQMHLLDDIPFHLVSDEGGTIKKRMDNFYQFSNDLDFITTFLYFFCKHYAIPYRLVSDSIFESKLETSTTKLHPNETLKQIYLNIQN